VNPFEDSTWEGIRNVYVDGEAIFSNSCQSLKQLVFKKRDRKRAEEIVGTIVRDFAVIKFLNVGMLIFDKLSSESSNEMSCDEYLKSNFTCCASNPAYPTAANQILAMAQSDAELVKHSVLVSNDRLFADNPIAGAKLVNPRKFMQYASQVLGRGDRSFCAWLIEKIGAEQSVASSVDAIGQKVESVSISEKNL